MNRSQVCGWIVGAAVSLVASSAYAFGEDTPCGAFALDEDGSLNCKIEVEGGCTAQCTPLSFKAGCSGGCEVSATQTCVDTCGEACLLECNPELLDCFQGCHDECDAEVQAMCEAEGTEVDCVEQAKAQCDMHCETSCEVPPSSCQDHCISCCTGGCQTQINFECDFACFAELSGGCEIACEEPDGAIFCNGQYVNAADIESCISYLAEQGIEVDVSAQGSATCNLSGCDAEGSATGCAISPLKPAGAAAMGFASLVAFSALLSRRRSRRRR